MSLVNKIFTDMTDSEIVIALQEMKEDDKIGIIRSDGILRTKINEVATITKQSFSECILIGIMGIYKTAAYRFSPKEWDL